MWEEQRQFSLFNKRQNKINTLFFITIYTHTRTFSSMHENKLTIPRVKTQYHHQKINKTVYFFHINYQDKYNATRDVCIGKKRNFEFIPLLIIPSCLLNSGVKFYRILSVTFKSRKPLCNFTA